MQECQHHRMLFWTADEGSWHVRRISRDGGGNGRTVTVGRVGSGNMRSAQGRRGDAQRAPHRLGGRVSHVS